MRFSIQSLGALVFTLGATWGVFTGCNSGSSTSPTTLAITAQPVSKTTIAGNATTLSLTATGSGLKYTWMHSYKWLTPNGDSFDTMSYADSVGGASTLTIPMTAPFDSGWYKCIVTSGSQSLVSDSVTLKVTPLSFPVALMATGLSKATSVCLQCHGFPPAGNAPGIGYPTLIHSDFLMADKHRSIRILFLGLGDSGSAAVNPIMVNGYSYEGSMFPAGADFSDSEVAGVLTYMRATYNGAKDTVTPAEVRAQRDSLRQYGHPDLPPN